VELNEQFNDVIHHNMALNGFEHYVVDNSFVGKGGRCNGSGKECVGIAQLLEKYGIGNADLVKIDIEGSEFGLFRESEWLDNVARVCMEVHPAYGSPGELVAALWERGFTVTVTDSAFRRVRDMGEAVFIYAKRTC